MKRLILLLAFVLCASDAAAQAGLTIGSDGVLHVREILADNELHDAIRSGLPLRVRFRVELWRDAMFDELVSTEQWTAVLTYDALSELYIVRTRADATRARAFTDFNVARGLIETSYQVTLRPQQRGRFYYTGSVDIETLSLSDLEELERWLKGAGNRTLPGAIGQGARRLFIRVLSLPERRLEARSERFRVP